MSVDSTAIVIRFALYLDLMALFGLAAFGMLSLRGEERRSVLRLRPVLSGAAILGGGLSVVGLVALAAAMSGVALGDVDGETLGMLLSGSPVGTAWIVRIAALATIVALLAAGWRRPSIALTGVMLASGTALGSLAWTGHGAMNDGLVGWVHLVADVGHLLAAGVWVGALLALAMLVFRPAASVEADHVALTHRALDGFSVTGTAVVGAIVATGLVNSWLLVGPAGLPLLGSSLYGQLLLAKLALFALMLWLADANRFRLVPALERAICAGDHRVAMRALGRSVALEAGCAVAVLALVAVLGTLEPIA